MFYISGKYTYKDIYDSFIKYIQKGSTFNLKIMIKIMFKIRDVLDSFMLCIQKGSTFISRYRQ